MKTCTAYSVFDPYQFLKVLISSYFWAIWTFKISKLLKLYAALSYKHFNNCGLVFLMKNEAYFDHFLSLMKF